MMAGGSDENQKLVGVFVPPPSKEMVRIEQRNVDPLVLALRRTLKVGMEVVICDAPEGEEPKRQQDVGKTGRITSLDAKGLPRIKLSDGKVGKGADWWWRRTLPHFLDEDDEGTIT